MKICKRRAAPTFATFAEDHIVAAIVRAADDPARSISCEAIGLPDFAELVSSPGQGTADVRLKLRGE